MEVGPGSGIYLPELARLYAQVYATDIEEAYLLLTESELRRQTDAAGLSVVESHKSGLYLPLVAEFLGKYGMALEQRLERKINNGPLDWLLWTQYLVLKKQPSPPGMN